MSSRKVSPVTSPAIQDQEVKPPAKPPKKRRVWSVASKLRILDELDVLKAQKGDIGAYLRRHGIFSSMVFEWKKMRTQGTLTQTGTRRGPVPKYTPEQIENERLNRENSKLKRELEIAKKLIEIQKKVAAMMEADG